MSRSLRGRLPLAAVAALYASVAAIPALRSTGLGFDRDQFRNSLTSIEGARVAAYVTGAPPPLAIFTVIALQCLVYVGVTCGTYGARPSRSAHGATPHARLLVAIGWAWGINIVVHAILFVALALLRGTSGSCASWLARTLLGTCVGLTPYAALAWCVGVLMQPTLKSALFTLTVCAVLGISGLFGRAMGLPELPLPAASARLALRGPWLDALLGAGVSLIWVLAALALVRFGGRSRRLPSPIAT